MATKRIPTAKEVEEYFKRCEGIRSELQHIPSDFSENIKIHLKQQEISSQLVEDILQLDIEKERLIRIILPRLHEGIWVNKKGDRIVSENNEITVSLAGLAPLHTSLQDILMTIRIYQKDVERLFKKDKQIKHIFDILIDYIDPSSIKLLLDFPGWGKPKYKSTVSIPSTFVCSKINDLSINSYAHARITTETAMTNFIEISSKGNIIFGVKNHTSDAIYVPINNQAHSYLCKKFEREIGATFKKHNNKLKELKTKLENQIKEIKEIGAPYLLLTAIQSAGTQTGTQ